MKKVRIIDSTLRDGMHAVSHQFSPDDMADIAAGLDDAGVDTIEVGHGDGIGGSTIQYGRAKATDKEYLTTVCQVVKKAKVDILLIPGIGTRTDLEMAAECGVKVVRVTTHCTEADTGEQHIKKAKEMGLEAIGFLMMVHMISTTRLVEQAKLFEEYGADAVYVTDSAGALLPHQVAERVRSVKQAVKIPVGFHAHNSMGLAVANSIAAFEAGACYIDGTTRGLGAAAGNSPTEVLACVFDKMGVETGIDIYKIMDVAEYKVAPRMNRPLAIDKGSLTIGWAGVYGSFLLFAYRAAEKYGVDPRDILVEMARRKAVGGQEDMILEVAYQLQKASG
ncbi:MAG: 4-hydroxy-2-oxovalerate aldolase [Negativicutes bacterium]